MHFLMSPSAAVSMKADYSNFAAVADQLLSMSPAEWARRSSAVQGIANDYGWERIADQMLSHYAQLLRDR